MWKKGIKDDNKLMKQEKQSGVALIDKYTSKKLKAKPTDELKYYEYLTYQRPILDELNYVSERMKTENINKQKSDFEFIEDLKNKREKQMKEIARSEGDIERMKKELFEGDEIIITDSTPTITTGLELDLESRSLTREQLEKMKRKSFETKEKASKKIQALVKGVMFREKTLPSLIEQDLKEKKMSSPTEDEALSSLVDSAIKRSRGRPKGSKDTQPRKSKYSDIVEAIPVYNLPTAPEVASIDEGFIEVKKTKGKKKK